MDTTYTGDLDFGQQVLMLKGLPGSGKSTWAKQVVAAHPRRFVRINKDDLRVMCHDSAWDAKTEKIILAARDALIEMALIRGLTPIVDDTNLAPKHQQRLAEIANSHNVPLVIREFDTPLHTCIERDAKRPKPVGEKVIRQMWASFLRGSHNQQDPTLPAAIIVDMDGTLALIGNRSPYEDNKADIDTLNVAVFDIMQSWLDAHPTRRLIIMSGRDEGRSRAVTMDWLAKHRITPDLLLMRPAGDTRKDSIVKRELFDLHVAGRYCINIVLDDRDQVVQMWRDDLGLTCLQVNWGNF